MTSTFWRVANDARNGGAGLTGYAACWLRQTRCAWPVKTCASNNADTDRSRYIDGFALRATGPQITEKWTDQ